MVSRLFLATLLLLVAACGGGDPQKKSMRVVVISPDSAVFEPLKGEWALQSEIIAGAVSRGLVKLDGSGQVVPDLATSWRVSDDGKAIIFRLRQAQWSDGREVTGKDFVRLFQSVLSPASRHPFKSELMVIENGGEVAKGRKSPASLGVISPISDVVEIKLGAPKPGLLQLLASPAMGLSDRNMSRFALGPFRMTRTDENLIRLLPNAYFDDPGSIQLERIRISAQSDAAIAIQTFRKTEARLLLGGTTGDFDTARGAGVERLLRLDPVAGTYGYRVVNYKGPLGDPRIRQAMAMIIDRDAMAASFGGGNAQPLLALSSSGLADLSQPVLPAWGPMPIESRAQDASQLMRSARGDLQGNPMTLKVALPQGGTHARLLALVAEAWKPLGITLTPVASGDRSADLRVVDIVAPADSAGWFLNAMRCERRGYCNPQVDKLLDQASTAPDLATRRARLRDAALLVTTDQPIIPLVTPIRWSLVDPSVLGWSENPVAQHPLAALSVVEGQGLLDRR